MPPTKQVLYIEDSVTSQLIMRRVLKDVGELTIATTLKAGRALLETRTFDLMVTDFVFPEGDALPLIEFARTKTSTVSMPIIVVSGTLDGVVLSRVLKAGVNEALPKPLNNTTFRELAIRMLTDPYVRTEKTTINEVLCLVWQSQGVFHEYSPDLNLTVTGATKLEAGERMAAAIRQHHENGGGFGTLSHAGVYTHYLKT